MKYPEITINEETMLGREYPMLAKRLERFMDTHSGWEFWDNFCDNSKHIKFFNMEVVKQFLDEFAENPAANLLFQVEAQKLLEEK